MKRFATKFLTMALSASMALSFASCEIGGGPAVDTTWQNAVNAYNAQVEEYNNFVKSASTTAYERKSYDAAIKECEDIIASLNVQNTPTNTIKAQTAKLISNLANIKTAEQDIIERINAAIDDLKLYVTYTTAPTTASGSYDGVDYSVNTQATNGAKEGDDIWFKRVNGENSTYKIEIASGPDDTGDDEQPAFRIPNKGVEKVVFDEETKLATFYLSKGEATLDMDLYTFAQSGVLNLFGANFTDLESVGFLLNSTDENGENVTDYYYTDKIDRTGLTLAAALVVVCINDGKLDALKELSIVENDLIISNNLYGQGLTQKKYNSILDKSATAKLTVSGSLDAYDEESETGSHYDSCRYTCDYAADLSVKFIQEK